MFLGYDSLLLYRPRCGILTFFLGFGYLIGCHVYYMSGDEWKKGGIDASEEGLREAQKMYRLIKLPSLIEYIGYCLCCGSHFAGPVYEMKDYLDWTEGKGLRGEDLHSLNVEELQQLERSLEIGLGRIIEKKGEKIMSDIADLQRKGMLLMEENERLKRHRFCRGQ